MIFSLYDCADPKRKITPVTSDSLTAFSSRLNDNDLRDTANAMVQDMLSHTWLEDYVIRSLSTPEFFVDEIHNESGQFVNTALFTKYLEDSLNSSRKVKTVTAASDRELLKDQKHNQPYSVPTDTLKKWAVKMGADFLLQGTIDSHVDTAENQNVIVYKIRLELTEIGTESTVWSSKKKIKHLQNNTLKKTASFPISISDSLFESKSIHQKIHCYTTKRRAGI